MGFRTARALAAVLLFALLTWGFGYAECPVGVVVVKGHVDCAPRNPIVRVQLVYPGNLRDSGEATFAVEVSPSRLTSSPRAAGHCWWVRSASNATGSRRLWL
jgi:hypothetical protein